MHKITFFSFLAALVVFIPATGCNKSAPESLSARNDYFKTSFQTEAQYVVETVVTDLAEQIYFAAKHKLPDTNYFSITSKEQITPDLETPAYKITINLDKDHKNLQFKLNINGPIWSTPVYSNAVATLTKAIGLKIQKTSVTNTRSILRLLVDGQPETIERLNQGLSDSLESDFENPAVHEQAALLLGAFMLREHSGRCYDIRSPLCRMTAHLAMADLLRNGQPETVDGEMARATLLTLIGNQAQALEHLDQIKSTNAPVLSMIDALKVRNTGDYRIIDKKKSLTEVELIEQFMAFANDVNLPLAWEDLDEQQKTKIDYLRIANQPLMSVEMGHELDRLSIPLEIREIYNIHQLYWHKELDKQQFVNAINVLPDRAFFKDQSEKIHVHIIGWGQWAMFFQRHLCEAIRGNFDFYQDKWGVPDEALKFSKQCTEGFSKLIMYPLIERFCCTNVETYHAAAKKLIEFSQASPQLLSSYGFIYICKPPKFCKKYLPTPNPHLNEWHNHNSLPGTAYEMHARVYYPSLEDRETNYFEKLHERAPYNLDISEFIMRKCHNGSLTLKQAQDLFQKMEDYSTIAISHLAWAKDNTPAQYEHYIKKAAQIDTSYNFQLADFYYGQTNDDKAAECLEIACKDCPSGVAIADHAEWRIRYYLNKGDKEKAHEIAKYAGEVYSFRGLVALAVYYDLTGEPEKAVNTYIAIDDRYNRPIPLIEYCIAYKEKTKDNQFDEIYRKFVKKVFPKGQEKVQLSDFTSEPTDGVFINDETELLRAAGLKKRDVIVALNGIRVHSLVQYTVIRYDLTSPEMNLIVWQNDAYHQIKASPPGHKFKANFLDYVP